MAADDRTWMERLQAMVRGELPPPPVGTLIGLQLVEVEPERTVFRLEADQRHANPMGTLHGGILCDLADAALGTAVATTLSAGESYTTVELSVTFLKPVWKATLTATAHVVRRTRRLGVASCEVVDEKGSVVAFAKGTCLVLSGEDASGR